MLTNLPKHGLLTLVMIVHALVWLPTAITAQDNFVIRDPVQSTIGRRQYESTLNSRLEPVTRKFSTANWEINSVLQQSQEPTAELPATEDNDRPVQESNRERQRSDTLYDSSVLFWPPRPISEIDIDIRDDSLTLPADRSGLLLEASTADWFFMPHEQKVFAWTAPNIRYQPLYFEDIALERYGQTRGGARQFVSSSLHFFKSGLLLPYSMAVDCPRSCDYPLGYCRPGNPAPLTWQKHWFGIRP